MSFTNMKISRKLGLAFAAVVATIIMMSATIFWNLVTLEHAVEEEAGANRSIDLITRAEFMLARQENSFRGFLLTNDTYYLDRLESQRAYFDERIAELRQSQLGHENEDEMVRQIDVVEAAMNDWHAEIVEEGLRLHANPVTRFQAIDFFGQNGKAYQFMEPIDSGLTALEEMERAEAAEAAELREAATWVTEMVIYAGVGFAVVISALLGFLLSRMIAAPVTALTDVMGRLAAGDNSVEVPAVDRKDEIGKMAQAVLVFKEAAIEKIRIEGQAEQERTSNEQERARTEADKAREAEEDHVAISSLAAGLAALAEGDLTFRITAQFAQKTQKLKDDFNRTAQQLQETMTTISEAIVGMRNGTGEISQAADDLSKRTEQQAASLEETAAALDQITATVKKTAEGAHQASEVTSQARVGAEKSGVVVRDAVAAMAQIEKSSQQIGQIIGVIDEIAFQTNLLALNAGVEAARAGEAGKGFAVVASEVRALAQRSAEAAKEIKDLISTSTQQVDQGVDLVGQTGTALETIVTQVAEITGLVTEIAASAREQSTGLGEVNSAVNQMDQVTQQNAAMVEQSTAASHHLAQEAEELSRLVTKFKVGEQAEQPQPTRRAAPAEPKATPEPKAQQQAAPALKRVATGGGQAAALLAQEPAGDEGWEEF